MLFFPREFLATATGVAALVFSILGAVFLVTGVPVVALARPNQVGLALLGSCPLLVVGLLLGALRAAVLRRRETLLRGGVASPGTVTEVRQNRWVRVNRRHPWVVRYRYEVGGAAHEGSETLRDLPAGYAVGASVGVVYDASDPSQSALKRA